MKTVKFLIATLVFGLVGFTSMGQVSQGSGGTILPNTPVSNLNTGIGINNPQSKLHVAGDIRIPKTNKVLFGQSSDGDGEWLQNTNTTGPTPTSGTHGVGIYAGYAEKMRITNLGMVGMGINNPTARLHIWTNKSTLANEKISTEDMTLELGVAANNGEYGIQRGDAMIWTNQTSSTPNLRGNLYLNTGSNSNTNTSNSRNIILGPINRNTLVVSDAGRVGIGLDNYGPITNVTRPERLLHVNSRNVPDIRFQNLPATRCGYILMVDDNGDVYRSTIKGNPYVNTGACKNISVPNTGGVNERDIFQEFDELSKKYDALSKEVETLKTKVK